MYLLGICVHIIINQMEDVMNVKFFSVFLLGLMISIILSGKPVLADHHDPLRGQAFSDPSVSAQMPDAWKDKPITYNPQAGDADITIDLNQQLYSFLLPLVNEYAQENNLKISYSKGTCGKSLLRSHF